MKAHAKLYVDDTGELTEKSPDRGIMIAAYAGDEIPKEFVEKYGLSLHGDKVVQKTDVEEKAAESPENKAVKGAPNKAGLTINKAKKTK
jgi:hypothetical protein